MTVAMKHFKLWYYHERSHCIIFPMTIKNADDHRRANNFRKAVLMLCKRNNIEVHTKLLSMPGMEKKKFLCIYRKDDFGKHAVLYLCEHGEEVLI